jgi:hypothetical protein
MPINLKEGLPISRSLGLYSYSVAYVDLSNKELKPNLVSLSKPEG